MKMNAKSPVRLLGIGLLLLGLVVCFWGPSQASLAGSHVDHARKILCSAIASVQSRKKIRHVLFSPDDDIETVLVGLIEAETTRILVAQYMLSNPRIADALMAAYDRGVSIEIVTDKFCTKSPIGKVHKLAQHGVPVYEYDPVSGMKKQMQRESIMHHKFFIFSSTIDGRSLVVTGSFNCTISACVQNQENLLFIEDANMAREFLRQFELLKKRSSKLPVGKW